MKTGRIIKSISGFYDVESDGKRYRTRARGVFRNQDITPLTGDIVSFKVDQSQKGYIHRIHPRKNELKRPPLANIDIGLCVCSAVDPAFSSHLLDRFLIHLEMNHIAPIIILTKADLLSHEELKEIEETLIYYQSIGYPYIISKMGQPWSDHDQDFIKRNIKNRTAMVMGQSGAGKSSLLNKFQPGLNLETKQVSKALGRGRHTTRYVEFIPLFGGLIADTPGFSSLDFEGVQADQLRLHYPDFSALDQECKFSPCLHADEPQCAVSQAVDQDVIPQRRYDYYRQLLDELKQKKPKYKFRKERP